LKRHRSSSKPVGNMRDRSNDMRVIYGQTCDLAAFDNAFEEQEMANGQSILNATGSSNANQMAY